MDNSPEIQKVARCVAIEAQPATFDQTSATLSATPNATNTLKAVARAVLDRNKQRNHHATTPEKQRNFYTEKTPEKLRSVADELRPSNDEIDDRHYCRECKNINLRGYCVKQRFRPVDDMPRNCSDFIPNGKLAPNGLSLPEKNAILRLLNWIGENNPDIISEVMDRCNNDPETREYYLMRANEVP